MPSDIGPYTPIPHTLAQEVGLVCAAVYGVVWRYCQMKDGICKASLDTLGSDINIDRATVLRSIKKLCELGYLIDQTPGRRNAPHTYTLSKSVAECNSTSVVMRNSPKKSVAEDNKSVAYNNSFIGDDEQEDKTVAESHLKKESLNPVSSPKKESERESHAHKLKRIGEVDYLNQNRAFAVKLSEICGNPGPEYVVNGDRRKLAEATAQLLDFKATINDLEDFKKNYWKFDDPPWVGQVAGQWGRYLSSKKKPTANGTSPPANKSSPIDEDLLIQLKQEQEAALKGQ